MKRTKKSRIETAQPRVVAEGKTKVLFEDCDPLRVRIHSKDDITAGDGKRHDVLPGKGAISNQTTCNVFSLLELAGLPVAFEVKSSPTDFLAERCQMLPLEVIIRRRAVGSKLERHPYIPKLYVFGRLDYQLHLKTSGKQWKGQKLVADDPLIGFDESGPSGIACLFDPHKPIHGQTPFLKILVSDFLYGRGPDVLDKIEELARRAFLALERAYCLQNFELVDFKIEFGFTARGQLVIADVIDAESVRLMRGGVHFDKQPYRDEGPNPRVMERFAEVLQATESFSIPRQTIIVWAGSPKDDTKPLIEAVTELSRGTVQVITHVRSMHKESELGLLELRRLIQSNPLSVILCDIGMSDGAGPSLSAHIGVPVITVRKGYREFPDDVWSSLRTPSQVPVSTMLAPANAALHALQILSMNNPRLYSILQYELEKRITNMVPA